VSAEVSRALAAWQDAADSARAPDPQPLADWVGENLVLSSEDSAEAGRYSFDRAPYQRGIFEALGDSKIRRVVLEASSQVGKTLIAKGAIGYHIDQDPCPILFVTYSLDMARTFSQDRLDTMVRDTACLTGRVHEATARDSGNTTFHKKFPGGHITMVGANAAGGLSSRPIRFIVLDEVDRYPPSAGKEGDPVRLAIARGKTFWNRKELLISSPTDAETSRIHPEYLKSDQRRFYVPCPHCGHMQTLRWAQVKWLDNDPNTAGYLCERAEGCGALWSNAERIFAVRCGKWIAEHPERKVAGFHISELYASFRTLAEIVADFLDAKDAPEKLKTFVNTSLAEVWRDEKGEKVDAETLAERREDYDAESVPEGAVVVTMAVDVQDDRLEVEFVGWGVGEESWGVDHVVLRGDPGSEDLWARLDDELAKTFHREDGAVLAVSAATIDTAGHYTKQAYAWARKHQTRRVYACIGRGGKGRPLVAPGKKPLKNGLRLFTVGVDTAKELLLFSRVRIKDHGAGYCHWHRGFTAEYFEQLTSERRVVRYSKGHPMHVWELPKGKRNEALDLRVLGMAALALLRPNFAALAERMKTERRSPPSAPVGRAATRSVRSAGVSVF
jgi:phage terminase large subunit GpA-like protein